MNNILQSTGKIAELGLPEFFISVLFSVVIGIICMQMYRIYFENIIDRNESLARSFVLMPPAITAIFWAIQYSLPLSLGLLGALSFVRFRTPIKKSEDIAFILLVIALSLLSSIYRFLAASLLIGIIVLVILAKKYIQNKNIKFLKRDTVVSVFVCNIAKDAQKSDSEIRTALQKTFPQLAPNGIMLKDIVAKERGHSFRYALSFKKFEDSVIPRIINSLQDLKDIETPEAFVEKGIF